MKFKSTFFQKALLILSLILSVTTQVWAKTITIDGSSLTTTDATQTITKDGTTFKGFMKQYQSTKLWFTSGTGYIYNETSLGVITKITLVYNVGGSAAAVQCFNFGDAPISTFQSSGDKTLTTSTGGQSAEFTKTDNRGFFNISVSSKNLQLVTLTIEYTPQAPTTATITTTATPLDFSKELGATGGVSRDLAITGVNLTAGITAELSGANASMFALSKSAIDMAGETISITYSPTAVGSHTATLSLSSAGANPVVISLSGQCTAPALGVPTITAATQIANDGFTANWTAASQAESYELDVYTYQGGTGLTTVVSEDFSSLETAASSLIDFAKESALVRWDGQNVYNGNSNTTTHSSNIIASNLKISTSTNNGSFLFPCALSSDATLSFDLKNWTNTTGDAGDAGASLRISHAADGSTFVALATIALTTLDPIMFVPQQISVTGGTASSLFKFEATKRMFLDNLVITTGAAATKVSVAGYPMSVADVTTYSVGGLSPQTTYYYSVAAIRGQEKRVSAEAFVKTDLPSSISTAESISTIYTSGGAIHLSAAAGEMIEVYNQMGQRLYAGVAVDGVNQLRLSARGVLVVKAGTKAAKVVL